MGIFSNIWNVFTNEYQDEVAQQIHGEKEAKKPNSGLRLKDGGTDIDEVIETLEENKIPTEFRIFPIFEETPTESSGKSAHQEFVESLETKLDEKTEQEEPDGDEELRRLAEKAQIHPLMPTKYSAARRAELRKFESELLKGTDLDI